MKFVKYLFVSLFLAVGMTANAQATYTAADGTEYQFKKHAFLNLEGGVQETLGEAKFSDLLSPNVQLGLGYQFSPVFGMRLQANGWQSKGGFNQEANVTYKYKYVAPGLDFMFNLSNLFCGWNPKRVFNLTAFLGGGANIGFENDEANDLSKQFEFRYLWDGNQILPFGRGGLEASFRLSDAIRFVIEANANITTDKYNSKKADRKL